MYYGLAQTSAPGNNKGCILQTMTSYHAHFLSSNFTKNHNYLLYRQLWHNREVTISHPYSLAIFACTENDHEDIFMLLVLLYLSSVCAIAITICQGAVSISIGPASELKTSRYYLKLPVPGYPNKGTYWTFLTWLKT